MQPCLLPKVNLKDNLNKFLRAFFVTLVMPVTSSLHQKVSFLKNVPASGPKRIINWKLDFPKKKRAVLEVWSLQKSIGNRKWQPLYWLKIRLGHY